MVFCQGSAGSSSVKTCISHSGGIITITDANTTIAYCRYDSSGEIGYLFVSPPFRRQGYATLVLDIVEARLGITLRFSTPISPLGRHVVDSYSRGRHTTSLS